MTNKILTTVVKHYEVEGHTYLIAKDDENNFWGFDKRYIDKRGKLTKEFNGFSGNLGKTLQETMRRCYVSARCENEVDNEKVKNNDYEEILKIANISEDSFKFIY